MVSSSTRVIQVTNIAPQATKDQMQALFGYLGKIDDIRLYPTIRDVACPVQSRICYVKFYDSATVSVAQHMTNTVFIDRALIVIPMQSGEIPDEHRALEMSNNGTLVPGLSTNEPCLPAHIVNSLDGVPPNQVIQTHDPNLAAAGLPYPPLPAIYDARQIEEIRRTLLVLDTGNLTPQQLIDHFCKAGEVKYVRFCVRDGDSVKYALIEMSEQSSVIKALQLSNIAVNGQIIKVQHSTQAIVKPQAKSDEAAQREIEEAMSRVKEAENLISAAIDPVMGLLSKDKRRTRSRSRSRRRSRSRSRRSRSRHRSRRRSRSRSRHRTRRTRSRSRHRHRSRSRSRQRSSRRSRSRSRHRSSRSKRDRSRDKKKDDKRDKSKTPPKEVKEEKPEVKMDVENNSVPVEIPADTVEVKTKPPSPEKVEEKERSPKKERSRSRDRKRDRSRSRDKKRERSRSKRRSRSRSRRKRSRSRDRKRSRSRDRKRSRSRDRKRSRSKDRKRSRDRSRDRKRSRSRDRKRSRSKDRKRSRSRSRRSKSRSQRDSKTPHDRRSRERTPNLAPISEEVGTPKPENDEKNSPDNMDISNSP